MALYVFWISAVFLAYVYGGFSLLVVLVGKIRNRTVRKAPITPSVSLIVAAYNEEDHIADRIENALAMDYPSNRLEIIVASDGSTDRTDSIAERYAPLRVRLLRLPRRGKIHALNSAVSRARGDVLVFSDANAMYARDALLTLVRNFADPEVGGVAGNSCYLRKRDSDSSSKGENIYWSYDKWLKEMESRSGSIVSAHGGIYAVRRELYRAPADSAVTDDFAISTAVVEQRFRLVYENEARSYEYATPTSEREFRRKVRLMTRGMRGVVLRRRLLNPFRYGFYSLVLLSHKVLRRLVPLFFAPLIVSSIALSSYQRLYLGAALAEIVFCILAGVGYLFRHTRPGGLKLFFLPFFYCMANLAALLALANLVRGERIERWQPQRGSRPEAA